MQSDKKSTDFWNVFLSFHLTTLGYAYNWPSTGAVTSRLVNEQWPTLSPALVSTTSPVTPHCIGLDAASVSTSGGWQAALIAALQLAASGIPLGYLRNPWAIAIRGSIDPKPMTKMMAILEYPHVDIDALVSSTPVGSRTVTRARNIDCETSQWRRLEVTKRGML